VRFTGTLARVVRAVEARSEGIYECVRCGARFELDRQICPDCGGCTIDRADWVGAVSE